MTDIFTASNGTRIRSRGFPHPIEVDDSTFGWQPLKHYVGGSMMDNAMAEWYRHRRDVELGRWRDPENPNMVVYRVPESEDKGGRAVHVIDEATGVHVSLWERDVKRFERGGMHATAARYFAAHPDPKPWHGAKTGEVWLLDIEDDLNRETPAVVTGQPEFRTHLGVYFDLGSPQIVHARKIWPEESDDDR